MRFVRVPGLFYGWWIVIASIPMSVFTGAFFYGFQAFFDPIVAEFGWSRTVTSVAFSLQRGESGVAAPVVGVLTDKLGPRRIIMAGGIIFGLGFIMLSRTHSLWQFYLSFFIIAVGSSGCSPVVSYITVAQWFKRKRGRAMAILSAGTAPSGFLVYILVLAISEFGWRHTVEALGVISWILILPLALAYRHRPQAYGLLPDGDTQTMKRGGDRLAPVEHSYTLREAAKTPAFWLLGTVISLWSFAHGAVISQLISALTLEGDVSRTMAGVAAAGAPVFSMVGRLGMGSLSDFLDKRLVIAASLAIQAGGVILFMNLSTPGLAILASFLYGVGFGGFIPVRGAFQADLFGSRNFGVIQGGLQLLAMIGGITGPILAGLIADVQDSYRLAFYIFAVALVASMVLALLVQRPSYEKGSAIP